MARGSPRIIVRVHREMLQAIQACIIKRNYHTKHQEWELSDFVRVAMKEKLAHMQRGRKCKRRKREVAI